MDDSVHDNAGFQYVAGLDPTLTRTATAKCCKWCDQLSGTLIMRRFGIKEMTSGSGIRIAIALSIIILGK